MKKVLRSHRDILKKLKDPSIVILLVIFFVGIFVRFYNTPDRFGFDKDPTRDALITAYAAENLKFPLVGPHSGIGSFTFGPWYYYFLILFQLLVPITYAAFYFIPTYSLLFILLMYFIGVVLKDKQLGLILAAIAAIAPSQVGPTAGLSNPNLVSVHAAASVLLFLLYMKDSKKVWLSFLWGLVIGIGINHHYQMIPMLLLPGIAYLFNFRRALIGIPLFLCGIIVAFLPLIYFNMLTDWYTFRGFFEFLTQRGSGQYIPNSWTIYLRDFWPNFWAYIVGEVPVLIGILYGLVVVGVHGYLLIKRKLPKEYLILIGIFFFYFIGLRYYSSQREHYYMLFLHPFLYLFIGVALWFLIKQKIGRILAIILIGVQIIFIIPADLQRLNDRKDQLAVKKEAALLMKQYPDKKFFLYNCGNTNIHRVEGLAFFLHKAHKLSEDGLKVGVINWDACELPLGTGEYMAKDVLDFTHTQQVSLKEKGWIPVSPESIYEETVDWWKNK